MLDAFNNNTPLEPTDLVAGSLVPKPSAVCVVEDEGQAPDLVEVKAEPDVVVEEPAAAAAAAAATDEVQFVGAKEAPRKAKTKKSAKAPSDEKIGGKKALKHAAAGSRVPRFARKNK